VDAAPTDLGGCQAFGCIVPSGRFNVVDHQVKGSRHPGNKRLVRLADDDMRAAAKLEDGKIGVLKNRA
jgi:hypothetical protein